MRVRVEESWSTVRVSWRMGRSVFLGEGGGGRREEGCGRGGGRRGERRKERRRGTLKAEVSALGGGGCARGAGGVGQAVLFFAESGECD